ncbi:restriction endonuclease subunit S [Hydrogenophaga pseudoflava]|uniref:restriction endonuclease subunit S n=1 Tax=Hydrogenophaga pseudoflava TaxID=47421 RepID=UPI0027E58889|nr:restriction endonuclease subunit S [Hydrogenophaga pseudoflava]MDQ7746331.1 restriction endonuclease subunit S [Hydrogenophaga pseudoflava]
MSWTPKPLRELLELSGRHRAGDQDLPVLSITMKHGLVDQAEKFKKRVASSDTSNYRVAYKNELVVGFPIDEGVLGFQTKYPAGIVSPAYDIWKLRSEPDSHIPYLERYLRSAQARASYASRMQGAVARRRSLTKTDFLNLEIPFPPLDDQIRIAHLLGKVEGLIAQRKQHLQQLDDLLKSVFLAMFGDPLRNEKGWDKPELKAFGRISTGNTPPRNEPANYDGSFIEWIKTDNITGDAAFVTPATEYLSEVGAKRARTVTNGALLVACIAGSVESIGRAALTDRTVSFNQQINAIQPGKDVNSLYLYGLFKLSRAYIQSHATKGMKKILTKGDFEKITMIKPPLEIQNQFAAIVEKVEALKSRYQQSLTDLEALDGALSQQAFKGELDLSRVALPAATIEGESPVAANVPAPINVPVIDLPETDLLLPALQDRTQLEPLLRFWLEAYTEQLGDMAFSVDQFMRAAEARAEEVFPDREFELGADAFELIKAWVFHALRAGRLEQVYPCRDDDIRVAVRKPPAVVEG